jgi:hypothetical protein
MIFGAPVEQESRFSVDESGNGSREIVGVAPGSYELRQGEPRRRAEVDLSGSQELSPNVGTGAAALKFSVTVLGKEPLPADTHLVLYWSDKSHPRQPLNTEVIKNACEFAIVPPGNWELQLVSRLLSFPILSTVVDGQAHVGNRLRVADKPLTVELKIRSAPTTVEGFAWKDGKGKAGVLVLLVPKDPQAHSDLYRRDESDSDGSFALRSVPPGSYTAIAIENGWDVEWQRPEILARYLPQGVAVSVPESPAPLFHLPAPVPIQPVNTGETAPK